MNKNIKDFDKVHDNGLKEIFDKNRKYDSIFDEHRRIYQEGIRLKVKIEESEQEFKKLALHLLKEAKFIVKESDLFKNNIINKVDKKNNVTNKIRIIKFWDKMPHKKFQFQIMVEKGEVRTSIELTKHWLSKKYNILTFIHFFKRETTFFGVNDSIRKKMLKNQTHYKGALLASYIYNSGFLYKDEKPEWVIKILNKKKLL